MRVYAEGERAGRMADVGNDSLNAQLLQVMFIE